MIKLVPIKQNLDVVCTKDVVPAYYQCDGCGRVGATPEDVDCICDEDFDTEEKLFKCDNIFDCIKEALCDGLQSKIECIFNKMITYINDTDYPYIDTLEEIEELITIVRPLIDFYNSNSPDNFCEMVQYYKDKDVPHPR